MLSFLRQRTTVARISLVTLACASAGLAYALLAPKWYRSVLTVVAAKQQKGGISGLLGGELAGLASGLDSSLGGADVQRIAAVLQSIAVSDSVIERFHLMDRYGVTHQESAREALWKHCEVKVLSKPGLVQLSCEDKDSRFAQEMLEYFSEHGNDVFRRVNASSASEEVRFLEKRVAQLRTNAEETAAKVREFQEKYGIVDLDSQSKALVSALSTLNAQRLNKQLELDYARRFSSGDETTLQQLTSQLSVMDQQMHWLERSSSEEAGDRAPAHRESGRGVFPAALEVPKLRAEYEALYRERKVAEATLLFSLERLEAAQANAARDTSTFIVLDPPTLATRHSRPKRSLVVLVSMFLGAMAAVSIEWARSVGGVTNALAIITATARGAKQ